MITYYVVAFILLHAFQVQAISKQNKAVRLGQSRGINLQSEPCLLLERDVLYPFGIDDHPDRISDSWRCRVHGLDAVHAGAKKGDHGIVTIQGFEQVLATNTNIKSGVTTLFVSQAYIENHTLKIPPGAEVAFGEITGTSHKRELVVTKDVTKKILAVRVTAKDSETTSDKHEISDKIFGTYGDNVNLKSQMEGCSHGRFMVEKASDGGKNIIEGVVEIQVKLNAIGTLDETLEEETENELETLFGTDNLPSLFDHVMICLPPGTVNDRGESGWVGYGYYNDYISVYNDDWCNYPSIQMVRKCFNASFMENQNLAHIWSEFNDSTKFRTILTSHMLVKERTNMGIKLVSWDLLIIKTKEILRRKCAIILRIIGSWVGMMRTASLLILLH